MYRPIPSVLSKSMHPLAESAVVRVQQPTAFSARPSPWIKPRVKHNLCYRRVPQESVSRGNNAIIDIENPSRAIKCRNPDFDPFGVDRFSLYYFFNSFYFCLFLDRHIVHAKAISSLFIVGKRLAIMASATITTPKKRSARQWNELLSLEYSTARETILPILASSLSGKCPGQWIPVLDLFEESAMHGLASQNIFKCLFRGCSLESQGTQAYEFEEDHSILLRHKFGNQWFVLGCRKVHKSQDTLDEYIRKALDRSNLPGMGNKPVSKQIVTRVLIAVSPIVSAALFTVSQLKAKRASSI
jgi:hypothetical protein